MPPTPSSSPRSPAAPRLALGPALLLLAALGCAGREARRAIRVPVTVALVESRAIPDELDATGTVEPVASADVTAQVGGLVTALRFHEGDDVSAGAALVLLDPRSFEATAAQAAAVLERDRAQARSARLELDRAEALVRQQLVSPGEFDEKSATAEALAASVLADSANLVHARLDLTNATVRAPISGRTGRLSVHVGDLVRANDPGDPVVSIHQLRPIRVRFSIPQASLGAIRAERRRDVQVWATAEPSDSSWSLGGLVFVDNQVDPATGTLLLKGEFSNADGALWPGAFARVRLRLHEEAGATVVPSAAVGSSQNGPYCYVLRPDTTVELRPIVVTRTWQGLTVVGSGLTPGETVVTDGQVRLSPGARASVRRPSAGRGAAGTMRSRRP